MNLRRTKLEIINDILSSIQNKNGKIKPTHLLYKSNLSHKKMLEYLNELIKKDLVKEELVGNSRYYCITKNGYRYLTEFKHIKEFSESFGL